MSYDTDVIACSLDCVFPCGTRGIRHRKAVGSANLRSFCAFHDPAVIAAAKRHLNSPEVLANRAMLRERNERERHLTRHRLPMNVRYVDSPKQHYRGTIS